MVLVAISLEALYFLIAILRGKKHREGKYIKNLLVMLMLSGVACPKSAEAYHRIDVLDRSYGGFDQLMREVESRTSIDVDKKAKNLSL